MRRGAIPVAALLFAVLTALLWPDAARAGWLIDEARFHASAHSAMTCADCHANQADGDHPGPDKLNKPASTSFSMEGCVQCHSDVETDLAKGAHGGRKLMKGVDYTKCVTCHNPHRVLSAEARSRGLRKESDISSSCNVCHEARAALPEPAPDMARCYSCHGLKTGAPAPAVSGAVAADAAGKPARALEPRAMCVHCHGPQGAEAPRMARMDAAALASVTHAGLDCLTCHKDAARFPHNRQARVDCLSCHVRHDEKNIGDAHTRVSCQACHLSGAAPALRDGRVEAVIDPKLALTVHTMRTEAGAASCARCHTPGNTVGAAHAVLPPKSVLCMGCHAGTFSVQDTPGRLGLGVFVLGFLVMGVFWFAGTNLGDGPAKSGTAASGRTHGCPGAERKPHGKAENRWLALFYDALLQRRLYRESPTRWAVHALIFFPFLFRFTWGFAGLLGSLWAPASEWPWRLLAKDWGLTAFLYDVSGLALLAGLILAAVMWRREKAMADNAPRHDWPALWLLLGITLTGFVQEGLRIALTGMPDGSQWAFAGHALARIFAALPPATLAAVYGPGWYAHAVLTALTVAYMPFSQLRHIFTAPVFLLVQTLRGRH